MPGELAKINITDNKLIKATIKVVGEENDDRSKKSSGTKSTATGGEQKNV